MRLTQHIQGSWSVGRQTEPNPYHLVTYVEPGSPVLSLSGHTRIKNHNRKALGNTGQRG